MASDFLEKTLEDIVYENRNVIHQRGLPQIRTNSFRQFYLPSGVKLDIASFEVIGDCLYFDIWELKRDNINYSTLHQAYGYLDEIRCLCSDLFNECVFHIILVGKTYNPMPLLIDFKIKTSCYTYSYEMNGISFKRHLPARTVYERNANFSTAMFTFGTGMLTYTKDQTSVKIDSCLNDYLKNDPSFEDKILETMDKYLTIPPDRITNEDCYDDTKPYYETNE